MKKYFLVPILFSVLSLSFIGPANADAAQVTSVKWTKNPLNVGALDPDMKDLKVGLRVKISDADGICSGYVRISRPSKNDSHMYYDLELLQGSSENGTWGADVNSFWSKSKGKWIVSGIYLTDCGGRVTKLQNMTSGVGGATGAIEVTTGTLGFAKIAAPKVLNLAWKEVGEDDWKEIPFRFIVKVKDTKGKNLPNAVVRLTACATLDADNDGVADDSLTRCSYFNLGKTNSQGVLIKQIYASKLAENGKKPDWADEKLTGDSYWDDEYSVVWESWISVLKTKTTTYTEYSKTINLYDSVSDGKDCLKAGC
jgi:hypothetical protein